MFIEGLLKSFHSISDQRQHDKIPGIYASPNQQAFILTLLPSSDPTNTALEMLLSLARAGLAVAAMIPFIMLSSVHHGC